jgi:uncharacterized protein YbaA (DUF1428 family)
LLTLIGTERIREVKHSEEVQADAADMAVASWAEYNSVKRVNASMTVMMY